MRPGYASAWEEYRAAGWTPTPLKPGKKFPPEPDVTGNKPTRYTPGPRDYERWAREYPDGNLMIVLPPEIVGIDVDAYHGGLKTLDGLSDEHGDLPTTWESTSRDDWSGIALYRVPLETRLVGKIDPGIEIVQWWHRYVVCWPSIHPSGKQYRWWVGTGEADIPRVFDVPELPRKWIKGLTDKPKSAGNGSPYDGDTDDWLADHDAERAPARARRLVRTAEQRFANECRHDVMVELTGALVALGAQGELVTPAIYELGDLFCAAVSSDRDGTEDYEYSNAVAGAVAKYGGAKPKRRWRAPPVLTGAQESELDELGTQVMRSLDGAA